MAPAEPAPGRSERLLREARWLGMTALACYLLLVLATYHKTDPGWSQDAAASALGNRGGHFGALCADILLYVFGVSAYWWVVFLVRRVVVGYHRLQQ
jgi:S-DNA-T family DNA segregation ATPase FtsK/SpoIIIE